jgi:hypothetical protein
MYCEHFQKFKFPSHSFILKNYFNYFTRHLESILVKTCFNKIFPHSLRIPSASNTSRQEQKHILSSSCIRSQQAEMKVEMPQLFF